MIRLLLKKRRNALRKAAFVKAITPYFWDIAMNQGRKTQWLYVDLVVLTDTYKNMGKMPEHEGTQDALGIIQRYRQWEAQSWRQAA